MHTLKVAQPRAELRQFIRAFAQRDNGPLDPLFVQPTPAQLEQLMTFELGSPIEIRYPDGRIQVCDGVTVCGGQSRFVAHMHLPARMRSFGVFFQPTGLTQLFGIPIVALTDRAEDGVGVMGNSIRGLWNRLGECCSFAQRVQVAETFFLRRGAQAHTQNTIAAAASFLFRIHGAIRISYLAQQVSSGMRQFERDFKREMGLSPKTFSRIARFQAALDAKVAQPARTWLDIAHTFGYHDQMHMIHDFETLGRDNPTSLLQALGDARPPAYKPETGEIVC